MKKGVHQHMDGTHTLLNCWVCPKACGNVRKSTDDSDNQGTAHTAQCTTSAEAAIAPFFRNISNHYVCSEREADSKEARFRKAILYVDASSAQIVGILDVRVSVGANEYACSKHAPRRNRTGHS